MNTTYIEEIKEQLGVGRIKSLLYFKSKMFCEDHSGLLENIYLLLDHYEPTDIDKLRIICRKVMYQSNFSFQYLEDIEKKGWPNFQLGKFGCFYILILSNAKVLLGRNIFKEKLIQLDRSRLNRSFQVYIEELFWNLDHCCLKIQNEGVESTCLKRILASIIVGMLVLNGENDFYELSECLDEEIIEIALFKRLFSCATKSRLKDIFYNDITFPILLSETRHFLYTDYLRASRNYLTSLTSQTRFKIV